MNINYKNYRDTLKRATRPAMPYCGKLFSQYWRMMTSQFVVPQASAHLKKAHALTRTYSNHTQGPFPLPTFYSLTLPLSPPHFIVFPLRQHIVIHNHTNISAYMTCVFFLRVLVNACEGVTSSMHMQQLSYDHYQWIWVTPAEVSLTFLVAGVFVRDATVVNAVNSDHLVCVCALNLYLLANVSRTVWLGTSFVHKC